jgi:hypothetical protein
VLKKLHPKASFWKAGDQVRQIGTANDKAPDFHGTSAERVAASQAGFKASFIDELDPSAAFKAGAHYVSGL